MSAVIAIINDWICDLNDLAPRSHRLLHGEIRAPARDSKYDQMLIEANGHTRFLPKYQVSERNRYSSFIIRIFPDRALTRFGVGLADSSILAFGAT